MIKTATGVALHAANAPAAQIQLDRCAKGGRAGGCAEQAGIVGHGHNQGLGAGAGQHQRCAEANVSRGAAAGRHTQTFDVEAPGCFRHTADTGGQAQGISAQAVAIAGVPGHQIIFQEWVEAHKGQRRLWPPCRSNRWRRPARDRGCRFRRCCCRGNLASRCGCRRWWRLRYPLHRCRRGQGCQ